MHLNLKFTFRTLTGLLLSFLAVEAVLAGAFLVVNFTSQAPEANWSEPWQNACEETSIVIVDSFYNNKSLDKATAKQMILQVLELKKNSLGVSLDESPEKIVSLINNFLNWEAKVVRQPTMDLIKFELDNGRPVIWPADGKNLKNRYFNSSGYHVFVLTGYDDETKEFITQEPGTRHGDNYRYSYDIILRSNKFFTLKDGSNDGAVAVFTSPELIESKELDWDEDGLSKIEELEYGTSLISQDTDNDGYLDKEEVDNGYSPLVAEMQIKDGDIIRMENDYRVYIIDNGKKKHILNSQAFQRLNLNWANLQIVSSKFFKSLETGHNIE